MRGGENAVNALQIAVDSLTNVVSSQQTSISTMRDSIAVLQFPADQRLAKIKRLIADESFAEIKRDCSLTVILSKFTGSSSVAPLLLKA